MTTVIVSMDVTRTTRAPGAPDYDNEFSVDVEIEISRPDFDAQVTSAGFIDIEGKWVEVDLTDKEEERAIERAFDIYWDLPKEER